MGNLTFISKYKKNQKEAAISPSELKSLFLYGIPIEEKNGTTMSDITILTYIRAAQKQIENYLNIKFSKQIIEETKPFNRKDWGRFNALNTSYPARKAFFLEGYIGSVQQVSYPEDWLVTRQTNDGIYFRQVHMVPAGGGQTNTILYNGIMPYIGFGGIQNIPEYWKIRYCTGFDKVPEDILMAAGKYASIYIFHQLGDVILGAGIANMSLGVDGLSQSIGTTSSATSAGYGARIKAYIDDLKVELPRLRDFYSGFKFEVL